MIRGHRHTATLRVITGALLSLMVSAAAAQTAMTAAEFEAYVTGRTLSFALDGQVYGTEAFHEGRRTTWAFRGEACRDGRWFPRDERICFVYDDAPGVAHCWQFWREGGGLAAQFMGDGPQTRLYEVQRGAASLACPGPQVGA